ncbi:MAG: hypothetical protein ACO1TE_27085 [Prosthecobacter sp.]
MPDFEVIVTAYKTVIVTGAEDEAHATDTAFEDLDFGDLEKDTAKAEKQITSAEEMDQQRRHGAKFLEAN